MIIQGNKNDVLVIGENTSKHAQISTNKMAKLQYLLTKGLYKDPITAVIAEWTNNGIDSVVQAGKDPIESPVIVKISKNIQGQYIFSVEDKGVGLDDKDFENICMNYLESTKEDDNETIGHFGIGMKSFLALERPATFTCRKAGIERKYLVYEGTEFVDYDLIHEKKTSEEDGVKAEVTINSNERSIFISKIKAKLAYYDTAVIIIDNVIQKNTIHRHPLFQWSDMHSFSELHIALKDVYYPIDWEALGISRLNIPVALRINLDEGLKPTPSRESYITTEATKKLILAKIKELAIFLAGIYDSKVLKVDHLIDGYDYINDTYPSVTVDDKSFAISELVKLFGIKLKQVEIDGMKLNTPYFYKNASDNLFDGYTKVGYISSYGRYTGSKLGYLPLSNHYLRHKRKVVLVSFQPFGNTTSYFKEKYGNDKAEVIFVTKNSFKRKLKDKDDFFKSYSYLLRLSRALRHTWRDQIKEWQEIEKTIGRDFIDETKVLDSQEFKDWLENKRLAQKKKRLNSPRITYSNSLNKQAGDITVAYSKKKRYGEERFFEKAAVPISSLQNTQYLTVIVDEEDKALGLKMAQMMVGRITTIKFAMIGKLEQKKLPISKQFIKLRDFMDTKAFGRLATALLIDKELTKYNKIYTRHNRIVSHCLSRELFNDKVALDRYIETNLANVGDEQVPDIIIREAKAHNSFDKSIWDIYERFKKAIKKFEFITVFEELPAYATDERKEAYSRLISQMLLFRKKYYDDLDKIEIDVKFV